MRALRARLAAKRKKLRQLIPTIITKYQDRVKYIHVPVDSATGTLLADVPLEAHGNVRPFAKAAE